MYNTFTIVAFYIYFILFHENWIFQLDQISIYNKHSRPTVMVIIDYTVLKHVDINLCLV